MSIPIDHAARAEDVRWMAETGESASGAAERLGLTKDALEKWCSRHDPESWKQLLEREPCDHNNSRRDGLGIYQYTSSGRTQAARRHARKGNVA